jgi:hypothetical protein
VLQIVVPGELGVEVFEGGGIQCGFHRQGSRWLLGKSAIALQGGRIGIDNAEFAAVAGDEKYDNSSCYMMATRFQILLSKA